LGILGLSAMDVPLSDRHRPSTQELALPLLAAVQVGIASILFPWLLGDWATALLVIAASWPFAIAAGLLSAVPLGRTVFVEIEVSCWLILLAVVRDRPWSTHWTTATAALLSVGLGGLWYLEQEFENALRIGWRGPIVQVAKLSSGSVLGINDPIILICIIVVITELIRHYARSTFIKTS
jgi:hypothetical protein